MSINEEGECLILVKEENCVKMKGKQTKKNQSPDPLQSLATMERHAVSDAWTKTKKVEFMHMQQQSKSIMMYLN